MYIQRVHLFSPARSMAFCQTVCKRNIFFGLLLRRGGVEERCDHGQAIYHVFNPPPLFSLFQKINFVCRGIRSTPYQGEAKINGHAVCTIILFQHSLQILIIILYCYLPILVCVEIFAEVASKFSRHPVVLH